MKVLLTNDDGIGSAGLHVLARAVADAGYDVTVAAPSTDNSGMGGAIGRIHADERIDALPVEVEGLEGIPCFSVGGPPGLCVLTARLRGFGSCPELVISGINPGANTGRAILHSGTVGAALTGANFGVSGIAVSLVVGDPMQWDTAASLAVALLEPLEQAPPCTVLNLNAPDLPLGEVRGVREATLAPFGTVRAAVMEPSPDGGHLQLELRPTSEELPPDCDTALVREGYATITSIAGIEAKEASGMAEILEGSLAALGRR